MKGFPLLFLTLFGYLFIAVSTDIPLKPPPLNSDENVVGNENNNLKNETISEDGGSIGINVDHEHKLNDDVVNGTIVDSDTNNSNNSNNNNNNNDNGMEIIELPQINIDIDKDNVTHIDTDDKEDDNIYIDENEEDSDANNTNHTEQPEQQPDNESNGIEDENETTVSDNESLDSDVGNDSNESNEISDSIESDENIENEDHNTPPAMCKDNFYFPHATNCSRFYVCNNGEFIDSFCPATMWFDPNYTDNVYCNYPEVICAADNSVCDCATKYPQLKPDPLIESHVRCHVNNQFYLVPSKIDCERYFICFNGNVVRMQCKSGYHFNSDKNLCDTPAEAMCLIPDEGCPPKGITFLPHQSRNDAFYYCYEGHKSMQLCPFYHIWDIKTESCRRRDEAEIEIENLTKFMLT